MLCERPLPALGELVKLKQVDGATLASGESMPREETTSAIESVGDSTGLVGERAPLAGLLHQSEPHTEFDDDGSQ